MNIIQQTTDPRDYAFAYLNHCVGGIHLNWNHVKKLDPLLIELLVSHELGHLLHGPSEELAWIYASSVIAKMYFPEIPSTLIERFFDQHRKAEMYQYKDLVLRTLVRESFNLYKQVRNT